MLLLVSQLIFGDAGDDELLDFNLIVEDLESMTSISSELIDVTIIEE